ncbi:hypothetical protein ACI8AC_12850 [Geodermatophilus sp. SYSU D00758]
MTRRRLEEALAHRFPDGAGSYASWTAADDRRCIDEAGTLVAELPLHHPPHVAAAVAAALDRVGLPVGRLPDGRTTVVPVGT